MKQAALSSEFRIVLVSVVLGVFGIDQLLGYAASLKGHRPLPKAIDESGTQITWRHGDFSHIHVALDLPSDPQREGSAASKDDGKHASFAEDYFGDSVQYRYEIGRYIRNVPISFRPESFFAKQVEEIVTTQGVSGFKGKQYTPVVWNGHRGYEMTCTFDQSGQPMVLHDRVLVGDHDLFYIEGWFRVKTKSQGEIAWSRMWQSLNLGEANLAQPNSPN